MKNQTLINLTKKNCCLERNLNSHFRVSRPPLCQLCYRANRPLVASLMRTKYFCEYVAVVFVQCFIFSFILAIFSRFQPHMCISNEAEHLEVLSDIYNATKKIPCKFSFHSHFNQLSSLIPQARKGSVVQMVACAIFVEKRF